MNNVFDTLNCAYVNHTKYQTIWQIMTLIASSCNAVTITSVKQAHSSTETATVCLSTYYLFILCDYVSVYIIYFYIYIFFLFLFFFTVAEVYRVKSKAVVKQYF